MADITKTISIVFGARSEVAQVTRAIEKDINNLANPLADAASTAAKLDAALAALAVGGMAYAIKTAGDFNGKFGEITTLISDTGAPISKFKADIKGYAMESTKSIEDINQALYTAVSAGVDYKESLKFLESAEKLSVAGRSELGDTTKVLISVLNAYGAGTAQAGKYSDIMFTTVKAGLTTMTELSSSLAQVTGLAASAGIPFETLSAAIAALTTTGMPTAQAITSIKAAISNIIKPTGDAEEMAGKLGIKFNAAALQTKGFEGVLWDAWKATHGNTEQMAQLFGSVEALNAVLVLSADKTGKFKQTLVDMGKAAGATQIAYDTVANEFKNINQRLLNSFKITLGEIGEKMMPAYGQVVGGLATMFTGIKIGIDKGAFNSFFAVLDQMGRDFGVWISWVGKAFPDALKNLDLTGLTNAFKELAKGIKESFGDFNLANPKDLTSAMQFMADTMATLLSVTKGMGEAFAPFLAAVKGATEAFNKLDADTKQTIGNILGVSAVFKMFGPLGLILMGLGTDAATMAKTFDTSFAAIENGCNAIKVAVLSLAVVFAHASQGMAELLDLVAMTDKRKADSAEDLKRTGDRVKLLDDMLLKANSDLVLSSDKVAAAFSGTTEKAKTAESAADKYARALGNIPTSTRTEFNIDDLDSKESIARIARQLAALSGNQEVVIEVLADGTSIETADGIITKTFPDGRILITNLSTEMDDATFDAAVKKIDEKIPGKKEIEIQAKMDLEKIKSESDVIQKSVEWRAKLDIANVEASTKILEASFKSIDNTITSTGTTITSLMGSWATLQGAGKGGTSFIEQQISDENRRRNEALEMQKALTYAQIDNLKARTEAIKGGQAMITIDGKGLQPQLEAFMFEILKQIQVRANAEGAKFLTGI